MTPDNSGAPSPNLPAVDTAAMRAEYGITERNRDRLCETSNDFANLCDLVDAQAARIAELEDAAERLRREIEAEQIARHEAVTGQRLAEEDCQRAEQRVRELEGELRFLGGQLRDARRSIERLAADNARMAAAINECGCNSEAGWEADAEFKRMAAAIKAVEELCEEGRYAYLDGDDCLVVKVADLEAIAGASSACPECGCPASAGCPEHGPAGASSAGQPATADETGHGTDDGVVAATKANIRLFTARAAATPAAEWCETHGRWYAHCALRSDDKSFQCRRSLQPVAGWAAATPTEEGES